MALSQQGWAAGLEESSRRFYGQVNRVALAQKYGTDHPDGRRIGRPMAEFDSREMRAKFPGTCKACNQRFEAGTRIWWGKQTGAKHVDCPKVAVVEIVAPVVADSADVADALLAEYDAINERTAAQKRRANVMTRKAIYRVHLNGTAKRYGADFVNVAMVPNVKYGSVKVSEFRGESIGVVKADGSFMFWQTVDQTDTRVKAIREAAEIILSAADPIKYAEAFAVESESCMRCGDDLVDDTSRANKLGPVCVTKWGAGE